MKRIIPYIIVALVAAATVVSCVRDNVYEGPAIIGQIEYYPISITPDDDVNVSAVITCLQDFTAALIYTVDNGTNNVVDMASDSTTYVATIPAQDSGAVVSFIVQAVTELGFISETAIYTYTVGAPATDYSQLVLNELNGNTKFIEIYNNGTDTINMQGCYIIKDEDATVWTAPDTSLVAGGFLLLYSEDVKATYPSQPDSLFFSSGLSNKKSVFIELYAPNGTQINTFERGVAPWGASISNTEDNSYARCPDGTNNWQLATPTPGTANPTIGSGAIPQI